ncbi:hypothetical protein SDC9_150464 [bioreactor metagenome]|uniref:Uncharacterized protein n=1 Tax=bioreactor metagenome TaxID=1076179 RepID=A0A645EN45_9ZZZZ
MLLRGVAQHLGEQSAVGGLAVAGVQGARERHVGGQAGLDQSGGVGIDFGQRVARVFQNCGHGLQLLDVVLGAQHHQRAVAGFDVHLEQGREHAGA